MPKQPAADSAKPAAIDADVGTTSASAGPAGTAPASAGPAKDQDLAAKPGASGEKIMVRVVPGIARYHAQGCILIRFLASEDLEVMTMDAAAGEGYVPCKACKPDQAASS